MADVVYLNKEVDAEEAFHVQCWEEYKNCFGNRPPSDMVVIMINRRDCD